MTLETARFELRSAAIHFDAVLDAGPDDDAYVNAITRLEVAAKAFADDALKAKLAKAIEALEEVSRVYQSITGACDEIRMIQMVEAALETKPPPGK